MLSTRYFYQIACEKQVFVTCGSDYHGKTKPSIGIGKHGCLISYEDMCRQLEEINMIRHNVKDGIIHV